MEKTDPIPPRAKKMKEDATSSKNCINAVQ